MSFLQSLILGIVQGLTEFLPISSSAHLVLVPYLFNWTFPQSQIFPFDVLVQIGTLVAVIIYFWKDLWSILKAFFKALFAGKPFAVAEARLGWYLILATIPAGLAGVFLKSKVEAAFSNPRITAIFLLVTVSFLLAAEFFSRRNRKLESITWVDALWIGVFQAFSIFPGISRSGSTISGGMTRHLDRSSAARFAFLMSIPIMLAAGIFSLPDLLKVPDLGAFLPVLAVGFIAAAIVGYLSIRWLLHFVARHSLTYFALYCVLLGSAVLINSNIRPASAQSTTTTPAPLAEVAVTPANTLQAPAQLQQIIQVETSDATKWLMPAANACAEKAAGVALITSSAGPAPSGTPVQSVTFRWGQTSSITGFASVIGTDKLAFIVNPQNPLTKLPLARLQDITNGAIVTWNDLLGKCTNCFDTPPFADLLDQPIQLFVYPAGEDAMTLFEELFQPETGISVPTGVLVPSTLAMNAAVLANINALGFLPAKAAEPAVRQVKLTASGETLAPDYPILALTDAAPQGALLNFLSCIQKSISS